MPLNKKKKENEQCGNINHKTTKKETLNHLTIILYDLALLQQCFFLMLKLHNKNIVSNEVVTTEPTYNNDK